MHCTTLLHLTQGRARPETLQVGTEKGIEGRQAVIYVLPGNSNFWSSVLPRLPCAVCKQNDQQLRAMKGERNKINTASNNKRISSFQYFLCPYLLKSLTLIVSPDKTHPVYFLLLTMKTCKHYK